MITQEQIKELFDYRDGSLYWKISCGNVKAGKIAGSLHHTGYVYIFINKQQHPAHRLIFIYHHGYVPKVIDHINRIKSDNEISNLRECTLSQNNQNSILPKDNKSGIKGVCWKIKNKCWVVNIGVDKKQIHIGCFQHIEDAEIAIIEARKKYHGEFANNGVCND